MTSTATTPAAEAPWKDGKRLLWLAGLLVPSLPFIGYGLVKATGINAFWWFTPVFIYGIVSLLEPVLGTDESNPPASAVEGLEKALYYRWCVFLFLPLQYAGLVWGAWMAVRGGLSTLDTAGLAVSVGMVNGIGIANAHELGHKTNALERWWAKLVLAPTGYGHFVVEHNRGHHVRVATPEDPASARMGEGFWAFLPRTVIGAARSAWRLEKERLARCGKSPWSLDNDVLNAWIMTPLLFGALVLWLGPAALLFLLGQAIYGFSLLEVVNYVEHYGLLRRKLPNGRYEHCQPEHSWNSNHIVTNVLLYHLQRHSDHHAHPTRRYQSLRHFEDAPQLPSGYASMIVLAYCVPAWRAVMDKRVVAHYGGDLSRINMQPSQRDRILARWGRRPAAA
ncbi:MAG: alkane 1-monooxygenase [Nevskia sp.]|nr:alkane 1-monooxygenase [Nevskia sp.]